MEPQIFTACDTMLNNSEIEMLLKLLDSSANNSDTKQIVTAANIKQKLSQLAEVYHLIQEDNVDVVHHFMSTQFALESAIIKKQIVSFRYTRYGTCHNVEPYRIIQVSGVSYLVAGQRSRYFKRLKKYCLDFITDLNVSDRLYDTIPWLILMKLASARTIWFSETAPIKVVMELDCRVAHFFRGKQLFQTQETIEEKEDGSVVISFEVSNRMDFFQQVARWIPHFRIIDPPKFQEFVCERMQQAIELNRPLYRTQKDHHTPGILAALQKAFISILYPSEKGSFPYETE